MNISPQSYIPLHLACIGGHTSVVGLLLSKSAKQVSHDQPTISWHQQSLMFVFYACRYYECCVMWLFSPQVSKVDKRGRTGLHLAAMRGHYHLVALLMGQGAELGAKDRVGKGGLTEHSRYICTSAQYSRPLHKIFTHSPPLCTGWPDAPPLLCAGRTLRCGEAAGGGRGVSWRQVR